VHAVHELRDEPVREVVVHHDRESASATRRLERLRNEYGLHLSQRLGQRSLERRGARCQLHAGANANEQRIVEQGTQTPERVTRCRLRQADSTRGAADVALDEQRIERDEQVEVDPSEIHDANDDDTINRLDESRSVGKYSRMTDLRSQHLFTLTMTLPPPIELGDTPVGTRRVFTVTGGRFTGDRLRGTVLPDGASDLLLVRGDGSSQQDVRLILRTDTDALILMTYRGVRHASREVNARIARGEHVAASEYYLRTAPFFETSAPSYAWINRIVSVAVGERLPEGVTYEVFEIL